MFREIGNYKGHEFVNIEDASMDIPKDLLKEELEVDQNKVSLPKEDVDNFSMWIRNELQPMVSTVRESKKLTNSPAVVVS